MITLTGVVADRIYTTGEVAGLLRVDPKTVLRWIKAGKFRESEVFQTYGGHHRIYGRGVLRAAGKADAESGDARAAC